MKRDRVAHGWSLRELSARTQTHIGTLSNVETGQRPMTEKLAIACDEVFPERQGWYVAEFDESRSLVPPGLRNWAEFEDKARDLIVWTPGVIDGLAQTAGYAEALLSIYPGVTAEVTETRLRGRMERQQRLLRDGGPAVGILVDMASLYRGVGSAEVMAEQCRKLTGLAKYDAVTLQVVPPVQIPLATAAVMIAGDAAYTENALSGAVYTEDISVTRLRRLIGSVRSEALPASASLARIREAERAWTGGKARTRQATAGSA